MFHFQVLLALLICFELLSLFSYRILVNNHLLKMIFWTAFQYVLFVFFFVSRIFLKGSSKNHVHMGWEGGYEDFSIGPHSKPGGKSFLTNIWIQSSNPPHVSIFKTKLDPPTDTQLFCTISFEIVLLKSDTCVWRGGCQEFWKRARGRGGWGKNEHVIFGRPLHYVPFPD